MVMKLAMFGEVASGEQRPQRAVAAERVTGAALAAENGYARE